MSEAPFRQAHFVLGAHNPEHIPADVGREIAFAGRSNSGKSSVINALTGRRGLARVSKTPGRTQQINFFSLGRDRRLVDLPGYGYANAPQSVRRAWGRTVSRYLETRRSLRGIVVIADARRPLTALDRQMIEWAEAADCPVHLLLNKADKLSGRAARETLQEAMRDRILHRVSVQLFSATRGTGVQALQRVLEGWLSGDRGEKKLAPGL